MKYLFSALVLLLASCSSISSTGKGKDRTPGKSGTNANQSQNGQKGENGEKGQDKSSTIGIKT